MCGRASLARTNPDVIADQLDAELDPRAKESFKERYNLSPTQATLIVVPKTRGSEPTGRLIEPAVWGWKRVVGPPKEPGGKPAEKLIINAMAETAPEKTMFKKALRERRGLMPVTGYYEWFGPPKDRRPIHFTAVDGKLLLLAVLFAEDKGGDLDSFTILTTGANEAVRGVHTRMPVIIPHDRVDQWLREGGPSMLVPAPDGLLTAVEVSKRLNTGAEGPRCWERDAEGPDPAILEALKLFPRPLN